MTLKPSGKLPVPKGTFGKDLRRLPKLQRSHGAGLSRVESRRLELVLRTQEKCSDFLEDDSEDFGEIPSTRRNLWEGFPKVTEASAKLQSHPESSRGGLEHCFPVMVTEFKLSEATSARALVASHSIRRLVFSFVTFRNSTVNVYTLACNYYVFLEIVEI